MRPSTAAWLTLTAALGASALTLLVLHPSHEPGPSVDPVVLVGQIQSLSRLETASVELQTTVHGQRGEGWIQAAAGEAMVFQGIGEARAGVDLSKLDDDDLWVDSMGIVWIRLPAAEVFDVHLDPERSSVLSRERGWFGRNDVHFEGQARRAALQQLKAQAAVVGLEEEAAEGARETLRRLMFGLGVEEVRFVVDNQPIAKST